MNLRQLELFIAIAESGSFSRGAEKSLLTQSTVSQHIASLESEVGLRLLDRTSRGAELTAAGQLFLDHARSVLTELATLHASLASFNGLADAQLGVGASNIPGTYLIPRLLPELARRHPGIHLTLVGGSSRAILDKLLSGEVELAVVGSHPDLPGCDFTPLAPDRLVLVVGPQHPWQEAAALTPQQLAEEALLLRESGSGSDLALRAALLELGLDPAGLRVAARLGSNEAIKESIAAGFGAAFLSESSIRREVARGELVVVPVAGLSVTRHLWLVTRSQRTPSPAAAAFAALLRETVQ
jgi:LysR family transcriptional regulator, low CO2-responsive transcriptional regulator